MKPAPFDYHAPSTIDDALGILHDLGDDAKVLAGGQSLVPLLNMRLALPEAIIDVARIEDLRRHAQTVDGWSFGAGVSHSQFEDGLVPDPTRGLLSAAAAGIGYRAIRNRGTLGGSLCHADSSAEWPVVMAALDAQLVARSVDGQRVVPAKTFGKGFFTNDLRDEELLTEIRVRELGPDTTWGLHKTARKPGEFAESLAVVVISTAADGEVEAVEAWIGAAADVPTPVDTLAELLRGRRVEDVGRDAVLQAVTDQLGAGTTAEDRYRAHVHATTMWRALNDTKERP